MHYRLRTISLAATTLVLSLTSPLLPLSNFEPLAAQAQTTQDRTVQTDSLLQTGIEQFSRGQLPEALATFEQVLALSRERGDQLGEAEALSGIGEVYIFGLYPITEALNVLQEALAIYRTLEDSSQTQFRLKLGEARVLALTGLANSGLNQNDEAIELLQQALLIQREIGDKAGVGKTLNHLADVYIAGDTNTDQNRSKEALELLQQALVINREVGNSSNETVSLLLLGWGHSRLDDNEQALKFLNEALTMSRENGYRIWEGQAQALVARVHLTQGNTEEALAWVQQAISILEAVRSNGTSGVLYTLGVIYQSQQQYPQALESYQQALVVARQIRDRTFEANILNQIGSVYSNQENYQQALDYYQQALAIFREVKNPVMEIAILDYIGFAYFNQKQYSQAREYYEQALAIAQKTENPTAQVHSLLGLGRTYSFQGYELLQGSSIQSALDAFQQALKLSQSAMTIAQDLPDSELKNTILSGVALDYSAIGHAYGAQKQYSEAIHAHQQALSLARQAGNSQTAFNALQMLVSHHIGLAKELAAAGEFEQALAMLQAGLEYGKQTLTYAEDNPEWNHQALTIQKLIYDTLAHLYSGEEQYAAAIEADQQALAINRQMSDLPNSDREALRFSEARILESIANAHSRLSEYPQALEFFQQSLAIVRELGDPLWEAMVLAGIGRIYGDLGQYSKAREYYQQALEITNEQGAIRREAMILNKLGALDSAQGEYAQALQHFQQVLQLNQELRQRIPTESPDTLGHICHGETIDTESDRAAYLLDSLIEHMRSGCLESVRNQESATLNNIGFVYSSQGRYSEALENYQQSLTIFRELKNRGGEATTLNNIGSVYAAQGAYPNALESYQQALEIQRAIGDRAKEGTTLNNIGFVYDGLGQYQQALSYYQQSLSIAQELGQRAQEAGNLSNIGSIHNSLANYTQALNLLQQGLKISQEIGDRPGEIISLNNIGTVHIAQGRYAQAFEVFQQVLAIAQQIGERPLEATVLSNLGDVYSHQGNYPQAMSYYQQALEIHREVRDRSGEGTSLNNIGGVHTVQGRYAQALESYQQALTIAKEVGTREGEAAILGNIGAIYGNQGNYPQSLEYYQQSLAIKREIGDRSGEISTLNNIAFNYSNQGEYAQALELLQQALNISQQIGEQAAETQLLNQIGTLYTHLGQYPQALEYRQQALSMAKEIDSPPIEVIILNALGFTHRQEERYAEAIERHQQALELAREMGVLAHEGRALSYLGYVYERQGEHSQALESFQQALKILHQIGDVYQESSALAGLGLVYAASGQNAQALESYQQAIVIQREIGDKPGESQTLSHMGQLLADQEQPELAIVFLKQSVNLREGIRGGIRGLSEDLQQSYTETVADTYRRLADLLLQQDRVLEAQQVLDLLKVQELEDYLHNVRGNNNTTQRLPNLPPEQQTWESYQAILDKAIEIGQELTQLRQLKQQNGTLPPAQEQRIAELVKAQEMIRAEFNNFTRSPEVLALVTQRSPETLSQDLLLQMGNFNALQDNLKNLQQNAVLLYPLILDDRIELILTTPDSPPIRRTVQATKEQLNQAIVDFRRALQSPTSDAKTPAQQLYNWLIKPLEADLRSADAQTIIYAPDSQLRYIPLAALYDGEQWLVQRYRINNITAASLTDLNTQPQYGYGSAVPLRVLAGAFATGRYSFTVGEESFDLAGLPFAGVEVENLAKTVPTTTQFIDKAFTPEVTVPKMDDYTIVHLATHAAFVVGTPDYSFILFGNGDRITLRDIQTWSLKNVDLVVLSACETGLGGKLGNGEEILGLGYQMQQAGARAAIASLWTVHDGGTQALMNAFYTALQTGKITKAEALRQAQIALITGDYTALGEQRGSLLVEYVGDSLPPQVYENLSHPYYWSPFILIGNGL